MLQLKPDLVTYMLECISVLAPLFCYSELGLHQIHWVENPGSLLKTNKPWGFELLSESMGSLVSAFFQSDAFHFNILPL